MLLATAESVLARVESLVELSAPAPLALPLREPLAPNEPLVDDDVLFAVLFDAVLLFCVL